MATDPSAALRRRRAFLGLIAILVLAIAGFTFLGPDRVQTVEGAAAAPIEGGASGATGVDVPRPPETPPYYLAWMSGGFPADFREKVRTLDAFSATVVVSGDTRWMTRSRDDEGRVVDKPKASFAIPIDAFAVNAVEYEPFLPEDVRATVITALDQGEGVLSSRSAALRGIDVGGTLEFGDRSVEVGAIAPDEAIGWSELLVSREVGLELGIVDDRYMLALPHGKPSEEQFGEVVGTVLIEGTDLRLVTPGGSTYMRVASGVNPPIVLKEAFGEFAARPDPVDPAILTIEPAWVQANIETRAIPVLGRVTCNVAFFPALTKALREIENAGLASLLQTYDGCWNARTVARSPTAPPSFHAYGAAIDINAATNGYGATPTMDERVVEIFRRYGFMWGGEFLVPDGMHFEYGEPLEDAA